MALSAEGRRKLPSVSRISAEREGSVALSASGAEREVSWRSARDERLLEIPRDF